MKALTIFKVLTEARRGFVNTDPRTWFQIHRIVLVLEGHPDFSRLMDAEMEEEVVLSEPAR